MLLRRFTNLRQYCCPHIYRINAEGTQRQAEECVWVGRRKAGGASRGAAAADSERTDTCVFGLLIKTISVCSCRVFCSQTRPWDFSGCPQPTEASAICPVPWCTRARPRQSWPPCASCLGSLRAGCMERLYVPAGCTGITNHSNDPQCLESPSRVAPGMLGCWAHHLTLTSQLHRAAIRVGYARTYMGALAQLHGGDPAECPHPPSPFTVAAHWVPTWLLSQATRVS